MNSCSSALVLDGFEFIGLNWALPCSVTLWLFHDVKMAAEPRLSFCSDPSVHISRVAFWGIWI